MSPYKGVHLQPENLLRLRFTIFILLLSLYQFSAAQCISTFPSTETFESNNGGWVTGGTSSDWTWGTPAKTVITGAGAGSKSWVTGGLTRNAYNNGENSWLRSRCYDFSTLTDPQVSFKIFWESERRFDGAALEYSLNGNTWIQIGSINSNDNCDGVNWYNTPSITYLGNAAGWSGNVQSTVGSCQGGSGSGRWLTAMHKLSFLAGEPSVTFRFVFGAGTQCNAYDGIAIDDFDIRQIPAVASDFSYECSASSSVSFFSDPAFCQQSVSWNFDDSASGASNTSNLQNPVHVFSAPGTYEVELTVITSNAPPSVTSRTITVVELVPQVTNILCNGAATGAINLQVNPPGSYQYNWNTSPAQTTSGISGLTAGDYQVTVSSASSCAITETITLTQPAVITVVPNVMNAGCNASNGSISTVVTGGTGNYNYLWSNGQTSSTATGLAAGSYDVTVSDVNGCTGSAMDIIVSQDNSSVSVSLGPDKIICPGTQLLLSPGTFTSYLWQDGSTSSTFNVTATGTYSVTVSDAAGCSGTDSVKVLVDCSEIYFPSAFTPGNDDRLNYSFGALGTGAGNISKYLLQVYNRAGQVIFSTTDPLKRWDGTYKGKALDSQVFVWQANFEYRGKSYYEKGTLTLIR